jgi:manganese/zinc/iron transport system permease protein
MQMYVYGIHMMYNYTLLIILAGTGIMGITAGLLGTFVLLRQQSLLGDAISHAALPGMALMLLATHSKNPLVLMAGGAIAGGIGTLVLHLIVHKTTLKKDAALGIVLSVFFGFGLVLMTRMQKMSIANQAILNKFLFGNIATLLLSDLYAMATVGCVVIVCMFAYWKEFTLCNFDRSYARTLGHPVAWLDALLTFLIVLTIVIGLQTVGVILMSSMLIAPAAAARQWTQRVVPMALLAICFAVCAGISGAYASSFIVQLPTGPTIVVMLSACVLISLVCAPLRHTARI